MPTLPGRLQAILEDYAPALLWSNGNRTWEPIIAELTENAHLELRETLEPDVDWKGLVIVMQRVGNRKSRVTAKQHVDHTAKLPPLPPSFPIKPSLERIWNLRPLAVPKKPAKNADEEAPATIPFRRDAQ